MAISLSHYRQGQPVQAKGLRAACAVALLANPMSSGISFRIMNIVSQPVEFQWFSWLVVHG